MQDKKSHLTTTSLAVSFSHWKKIMSATYHVYLRYHVYTGYVYVHPNRHRCTWKGEAEWKHLYHWNYVIDRTGFFAFLMFSLQINSPVVHRSILGYSQWFLRTAKSQNQNGNMSKCVRFFFCYKVFVSYHHDTVHTWLSPLSLARFSLDPRATDSPHQPRLLIGFELVSSIMWVIKNYR